MGNTNIKSRNKNKLKENKPNNNNKYIDKQLIKNDYEVNKLDFTSKNHDDELDASMSVMSNYKSYSEMPTKDYTANYSDNENVNNKNKRKKSEFKIDNKININDYAIKDYYCVEKTNINNNNNNFLLRESNFTNYRSTRTNTLVSKDNNSINKFDRISNIKDNINIEKNKNSNNSKNSKNLSIILREKYYTHLYCKGYMNINKTNVNNTKNINNNNNNNNKSTKLKSFNNVIIFDWDDTLFPTSLLFKNNNSNGNNINYNNNYSNNNNTNTINKLKTITNNKNLQNNADIQTLINTPITPKIVQLEQLIIKLFTKALSQQADVFIVTNAIKEWVFISCKVLFPKLYTLLNQVKVISARENFEKYYAKDVDKWKYLTFKEISYNYNKDYISNIIIYGDSMYEINAAEVFKKEFKRKKLYLKTVKFKQNPCLDTLLKELTLVNSNFDNINKALRDMNIEVGKK